MAFSESPLGESSKIFTLFSNDKHFLFDIALTKPNEVEQTELEKYFEPTE